MRSVVFWSLFPFVIPQAIWVRKTAPRFGDAEGPSSDVVGTGDKLELIAIGDSIISGVGAPTLQSALVGRTAATLSQGLGSMVSWSSLGKSGARSSTVIEELLPHLPGTRADCFIICVGVNDITFLTTLSTFRRNLETILGALQSHSPNAKIAVSGIPPLKIFPLLPQPLRWLIGLRGDSFDAVIQEVVLDHPHATHVPITFVTSSEQFAADGFHPSTECYVEFGKSMGTALIEALRECPVRK